MTPSLLVRDARLLTDGTPADALSDLLVEGGRITAVTPAGRQQVAGSPDPLRLQTLDAGGRTVLPGFVDCHVHMTTSPEDRGLASIVAPESLRTLSAVPHLAATLAAGVTTVRDLAGSDSGLREAVARGWVAGPTMTVAVRILSVTGGHGDWRTVDGLPLDVGPGAGAVADSPQEFVRAVREVVRQGADWVKVAASGGMTSPGSDPDHGGLSRAELDAVVAEARRHGVRVAAHAQGTAGIAEAVRAGVDSIEHGYLVDDATIEQMLARGTFLVPTLSTLLRPVAEGTSPAARDRRLRYQEEAVERISRAIAAGVQVALGTDAGIVAHGSNLSELGHLVDLGMSAGQAIGAGTSSAARLLGLEDSIGRVAPGMTADLVVLGVDPLTHVHDLHDPRSVTAVVHDGAVVATTAREESAA